MTRILPAALIVLLVSVLGVATSTQPLQGGFGPGCTITVNGTGDEEDDTDSTVTLREAMLIAGGFTEPGVGEEDKIVCLASVGLGTTDTIVFDESVFPPGSPATIAIGSALPAIFGTTIHGTGAGVIVDGQGGDFPCFFLPGSLNEIRGLHITGCQTAVDIRPALIAIPVSVQPQGGVVQANQNLIADNIIENNGTGVRILVESIHMAIGNRIAGNLIGSGGNVEFEHNGHGIVLLGATDTYIGPDLQVVPLGGQGPGNGDGGNVISGNLGVGVAIEDSPGTTVTGNFIGTDATGTTAVPNDTGIAVEGSPLTSIGGPDPGQGNLISGNDQIGVLLGIGSNYSLAGNRIGTDVTGNAALGNGTWGVALNATDSVQVGGSTPGARNIISANGLDGIVLTGFTIDNSIRGNYIGVGADGVTPLGNGGSGVIAFLAAGPNSVGGEKGQNLIAFNEGDGVRVTTEVIVRSDALFTPQGGPPPPMPQLEIMANSIHSNSRLGINLVGGSGVDLNDDQDPDDGPNGLQNYPLLTSAETNGMTTITGTLNSTPNTGFNLLFYASEECDPSDYGEGQTYLGSRVVNTDPAGNVAFDADVAPAGHGQFITATAADALGRTSEFSACIAVKGGATPTPVPTPVPTPEPTPSATPEPTPEPGILGDADCDLDVDSIDALHVLRDVAALEPQAECIQQGDVQCDGDIDSVDGLGILTYVAALPPLPQEPDCPAIGDPVAA